MNDNIQGKYINMLNSHQINLDCIMDYMVNFVPTKLYRYMGFGQFWKENLFKGQIHLSKPSEFNDPFDCVAFVDMKEFWNKYGNPEFIKNNGFSLELPSNPPEELLSILHKEMIGFTQDEMRVCCFTECKNSLLMWSHYANSHKGFCVEYDTNKIPQNIRRFFLPVVYQKQIYNATHDLGNTRNNAFNFLFFKSKEWSYEKEWRIAIYQEQLVKPFDFLEAISCVTLGINCEDDNKNNIVSWAKNRQIPVCQEIINYKDYSIDIKRLI